MLYSILPLNLLKSTSLDLSYLNVFCKALGMPRCWNLLALLSRPCSEMNWLKCSQLTFCYTCLMRGTSVHHITETSGSVCSSLGQSGQPVCLACQAGEWVLTHGCSCCSLKCCGVNSSCFISVAADCLCSPSVTLVTLVALIWDLLCCGWAAL